MVARLETKVLIPGMQIAQTIMAPSGKILLQHGTHLKMEYIRKIKQWGIQCVNVVLPTKFDCSKQHFLIHYWKNFELAATAFETVRILKEVPIIEFKELAGHYIDLMIDMIACMESLSLLQAHNEYSFKHSLNVAIIAGIIGKWLGYTRGELKDIILAGLLHDVGKTLIPVEILNKPGKLSVKEMDIAKQHSFRGYNLLQELADISREVKIAVFQHHERLDGSGYPLGLIEDQISVFSKIIAIADMFDAMTNERVYRSKMSLFFAVQTIVDDMNHKLDPIIGKVFLKNIQDFLSESLQCKRIHTTTYKRGE